MNNINYLQVLKNNYKLVLAVVFLVVFVGLLVTVFQPFKYRSTTKVLVIQTGEDIDSYSALRSAEKISKNLSYIIHTGSFRQRVLSSQTLEHGIFPIDPVERQEAWEKAVKATPISDTGILRIDVYLQNPAQATILAGRIADVLSTNGAEYIGSGQIAIKTVDQPITSNYPVKPNIFLNLGTSTALGILLALGYVLFVYHEKEELVEMDTLDQAIAEDEEKKRIKEKKEKAAQAIQKERQRQQDQEEQGQQDKKVFFPQDQKGEMETVPVQINEGRVSAGEGVYGSEEKREEEEDAKEFYKMLFPEKE